MFNIEHEKPKYQMNFNQILGRGEASAAVGLLDDEELTAVELRPVLWKELQEGLDKAADRVGRELALIDSRVNVSTI